MIPINLSRFGFDTSSDKIAIESLTEIRYFIKLNFEKTENINPIKSSYGLKGIIENNLKVHVANGDFVAAMILEGFKFKQSGKNAYFNISIKSIKRFLPCV